MRLIWDQVSVRIARACACVRARGVGFESPRREANIRSRGFVAGSLLGGAWQATWPSGGQLGESGASFGMRLSVY